MKISGKTKVIALMGWPVEHSFSPRMHNAAFESLGMDFCYVAFPVRPEVLKDAVRAVKALGLAGLNVTVPHKENVMDSLQEVDEEARFIGAVNTVVVSEGGLKGYNTDGRGFMRSLSEEGIGHKGKRILILGAGGASRAISYYLSRESSVFLFDLDGPKAERLAEDLRALGGNITLLDRVSGSEGFEIVINATPLGLREEDPLPLEPSLINPSHAVGDLIYKETRFLKEASKKGARTWNGLGMLLWQGALAFKLWTEVEPPHDVMRAELLECLRERTR